MTVAAAQAAASGGGVKLLVPPGAHAPASGLFVREVTTVADAVKVPGPAVLLLTGSLAAGAHAELAALPDWVAVVAVDAEARTVSDAVDRTFLAVEPASAPDALADAVRAAARHALAQQDRARTWAQLQRLSGELRELNRIGMALMSERDPERLLGLILTQARRLTTSDAGSLYLVDEDGEGTRRLHFLRAQNDSLPDMPDPDFTLPLDRTSLAGYVALTGEPLVVQDAYTIGADRPYAFNRGFDEEHGYRAKSMLVVPMKDHKDQVVGVIQLINRKNDSAAVVRSDADADIHVLPYGAREVEIVHSLAGQAAVSIENGRLYRAIENLFEGFIEAAVTAIDQRDPTTSGHSVRVTELTMGLAELVNAATEGRFADVRFSREELKQLRYAGLLHDFGKVGVREEVLVKRRKLPPVMWERVEARFALARRAVEAAFERERADRLELRGNEGYDAWVAERRAAVAAQVERLDRWLEAVRESNEPRILPQEAAEVLDEIASARLTDLDGRPIRLLEPEELAYLRIRRGSLSEEETEQIQSHVVHSFNFLREIPWTEELSRIDAIVRGHHEKLNGGGYPDGVLGDDIPLETRMMTVADIFDALTASDRPYKKAMPVEEALEILKAEADEGGLDADIVDLFIRSKVYERVLDRDWREM